MDLDSMDWTPFFYVGNPPILGLSIHEVTYCTNHNIKCWANQTKTITPYIVLLGRYYERFGAHMPIPIRKSLLLSLARDV